MEQDRIKLPKNVVTEGYDGVTGGRTRPIGGGGGTVKPPPPKPIEEETVPLETVMSSAEREVMESKPLPEEAQHRAEMTGFLYADLRNKTIMADTGETFTIPDDALQTFQQFCFEVMLINFQQKAASVAKTTGCKFPKQEPPPKNEKPGKNKASGK
jgi:hypothetical protein